MHGAEGTFFSRLRFHCFYSVAKDKLCCQLFKKSKVMLLKHSGQASR